MRSSPFYRRNFALIMADYVLFSLAMSLVGVSTVLPAFVQHLTQSAPVVGLVTAVWNGAWLAPQLLAAQSLTHRARKKPILVLTGLIGRPAFLMVSMALLSGVAARPAWMMAVLLASLAFFWGADAFCTIAWFDIVAKTIPPHRRGRLFGSAQILGGLLTLGAAAFVSFMLGPTGPAFPQNYAWLFGLASGLVLLGLGALALIHEPPESAPVERVGWRAYASQLGSLLRHGSLFRRVILARGLDGIAMLATPFFVVYAVDVLGCGAEMIGVFVAAQTWGSVMASLGLGALSERVGAGAVIRVAVLANLSGPLLALLTFPLRSAAWLWLPYTLVFALLGVVNSAVMLGWMDYLLQIAPPGQRPTYTGLANTLTGLLIPMPILGGWLLQVTSYPVLFTVALVGPLLAWALVRTLPQGVPLNAGENA